AGSPRGTSPSAGSWASRRRCGWRRSPAAPPPSPTCWPWLACPPGPSSSGRFRPPTVRSAIWYACRAPPPAASPPTCRPPARPAAAPALRAVARLPAGAELLGPVPAADGQERYLVRVPRAAARRLADELRAAAGVRSARKSAETVRIQVDPLELW